MKKLKWDCPFCGSAGELIEVVIIGDDNLCQYQCSNYECDVKPATLRHTTKKKARKVWDRRVK